MKKPEPESPLHVHPRDMEVISLTIPQDVFAALQLVAAQRDMSYQALLRFYIGQGLRQDLARLFGERVLGTTSREPNCRK